MLSRRLALHRSFQGHIACPKPKVVCALSLKRYIRLVVFTTTPSFSLSGFPLPISYLTDLLFLILFLFIVTILYSLSVLPSSVNSSLCLSLSLSVSACLCLCLCALLSGQLCTEDKTTKKSNVSTLWVMFQLCRQCFSLENQEQRTQKSNVSTLQTMFQSGQTRPESTERERNKQRER